MLEKELFTITKRDGLKDRLSLGKIMSILTKAFMSSGMHEDESVAEKIRPVRLKTMLEM